MYAREPQYGYGSNNGRYGDNQQPFGQGPQTGGGGNLPALLGQIMRWPMSQGTMDPVFNGQLFGAGTPDPVAGGDSGGSPLLSKLMEMFGGDLPPKSEPGHQFMDAPGPTGPNADQAGLAQIMQAIMGQSSSGPTAEDLQAALSQSAAGIGQQYGAEIGALRNANQGARQDTRHGSAEVQKLYGALAKSYNKAGKREFKQGKHLSNQLQGMGERAQQGATNQAAQLNESSMAAAQGLGLADLGQQLVSQNNQVAQQQGNVAGQRGQMAANTALGEAGNNRTYMQTGGQSSRLEGTNQSADMYSQLQDYLQGNRSQMASLAGERAAANAAANASITSSYASSQGDAQQQLIDNLMSAFGLARGVQNDNFDQQMQLSDLASQGQGSDPYGLLPDQVSGPAKLLSQYGDQNVSNLFGSLSGSNEMGTGYFNPGSQPGTQQALQGNFSTIQQYVKQVLGDQWTQLSPADQSTLVSALMLQLQGSSTTQAMP